MILQSLVNYYERLAGKGKIARPGWCNAKVSWALDLREDGSLRGVMTQKEPAMRGKKEVRVPVVITVPAMVSRSSGISANFLCDNSKYMLGVDADDSDPVENEKKQKRARECFEAATTRHLELLRDVDSEAANAVKAFFGRWDPQRAKENPAVAKNWDSLTDGGNLIFYVNGKVVQEDAAIVRCWEDAQRQEEGAHTEICLVTGKRTEIARIHTNIKGVAGAQSSGAALVSFNAPAFESYNKSQSYNAPVGTYAMFAYTTALNYLLAERKYVKQFGDITVVFWAEEAGEECQELFLAACDPTTDNQELVKDVFDKLEKGEAIDTEGARKAINLKQKFYILGLSPNAARLAVRFFYEDAFENVLKHLEEHYKRMEIVRSEKNSLEYLGVWQMLQETVNKKSRDKKPQDSMAGRTLEAILSGGRYPESLYSSVLRRIRSEQDDKDARIYKITRGRAAIIKAYLLRNTNKLNGEEAFIKLNETCKDTAYILGREFSVLEAIQEDANPGINATIKDRFFNSACATPAIIFPTLFRLKNSHIRKLEKGKSIYYEKELTKLQSLIPAEGYPKRLSTAEQGQFILGYYHQNQKRFEKREEKADGGDN